MECAVKDKLPATTKTDNGVVKRERGITRASDYFFNEGFSLLVMARSDEMVDDG
jgi:hypothetical protein